MGECYLKFSRTRRGFCAISFISGTTVLPIGPYCNKIFVIMNTIYIIALNIISNSIFNIHRYTNTCIYKAEIKFCRVKHLTFHHQVVHRVNGPKTVHFPADTGQFGGIGSGFIVAYHNIIPVGIGNRNGHLEFYDGGIDTVDHRTGQANRTAPDRYRPSRGITRHGNVLIEMQL